MSAESDTNGKKEILEILSGDFPEMPTVINNLDHYNLGRAIVSTNTRTHKEELLGYILPIDAEQTRHITLFRDGLMVITEPREDEETYKDRMSANTDAMKTHNKGSGAEFIHHWIWSSPIVKITRSNQDESAVDEINHAVDKAVTVATELKEKRDEARRVTATHAVGKFKELFGTTSE